MARVVVVGGGFAGLAVAARLARGRHLVTVVERTAAVGGRLRPMAGAGEVVGAMPSTFTMPAVLRDLFRKTGKPIDDVLELVPVDPARRYVFADGSVLDLPSGNRAATIAAFDASLGAGSGAEWEALLVRGREMWEVLRRDVVEASITGRRELVRALASRRAVRTLQPWRSLSALGAASLTDLRARRLLESYAVALGTDPHQAPAALAVLPYLEHAFGVWEVAGGMPALVEALQARAALRGAEVRTGADVSAVTVRDGRATGVVIGGDEHLPADVVVLAVDVRSAARLVPAGLEPWRSPAKGRPGRSVLTVVVSGGAEPSAAAATGETVYLDSAGAIRVERHGATAGVRWTVSATVPAHDPAGTDWRSATVTEQHVTSLLVRLAEHGLDLRDATLTATQTPADLEQQTAAPGGALHGPPLVGLTGAFGRAANASSVPGLYAVGASAHPGPGLPFIGLSAALVAELIGVQPRSGPVTP